MLKNAKNMLFNDISLVSLCLGLIIRTPNKQWKKRNQVINIIDVTLQVRVEDS